MIKSLKLQPFDENEINKCINVEHRFLCSICVEICFSIEKLKLHYINVHGFVEDEKEEPPKRNATAPKICAVCNLPFKNSKTLSKHVKHVHNKIKSHKCTVCSKLFSRKAALDIHLRQHLSDPDSAKILACPNKDCNFKASDPSVLSKHKKLHQTTNEAKYKCLNESCNYYAIQTNVLKNHMMSKHPDLYHSKMKCSYMHCEFVSVNPERLKRHLNDHDMGLLDKTSESDEVQETTNLNSSMEISSDNLFTESTDSIANHPDTGGVTIIHHIHNTSSTVHSEDAVF